MRKKFLKIFSFENVCDKATKSPANEQRKPGRALSTTAAKLTRGGKWGKAEGIDPKIYGAD